MARAKGIRVMMVAKGDLVGHGKQFDSCSAHDWSFAQVNDSM